MPFILRFLCVISFVILLSGGPALAHGPTIMIGHDLVEPTEITIEAGQTVHFINKHNHPGGHQVVGGDGSWQSPSLGLRGDWHHTFESAGVFPFHIAQHPDARGKVIVLEKDGAKK